MKTIAVLGAGRSASALITYLLQQATAHGWKIVVGDVSEEAARQRIGGSTRGEAVSFDINNEENSKQVIKSADVVISLLPAHFHPIVAQHCLAFNKHLLTASYVSKEMEAFDAEAKSKNILLLNECGLDPGIDHMSAMQVIDKIKLAGGSLLSFDSFTGGLISPETDKENPWRYKFTWNPRNVVLAGQGGAAKYVQDGVTKYIPYHRLFQRPIQVTVPGIGGFDGYANRDSLKYRTHYGIDGVPTLKRGTLRKAGYCAAWDCFVQLGCTDDTFRMELPADATWRDYIDAFLPYPASRDTRINLAYYLGLDPQGPVMAKLDWLGLFSEQQIGVEGLSPAATLQHLLEQKWVLGPNDKDLVVMWHRFRYSTGGVHQEIHASLAVIGDDQVHTAMARTVGLPIGIGTKLLLNGKITDRGVLLPLKPEIYDPILDELEKLGVVFKEDEIEV